MAAPWHPAPAAEGSSRRFQGWLAARRTAGPLARGSDARSHSGNPPTLGAILRAMTEPKGHNAARRAIPPRDDPDRTFAKRVVRNGLGIVLLLLGIAGLVLPILQGWLMILVALSLIDLPSKHRIHVWLLRWRWYQKLASKHDEAWARWRAFRQKRRAKQR